MPSYIPTPASHADRITFHPVSTLLAPPYSESNNPTKGASAIEKYFSAHFYLRLAKKNFRSIMM